MGLIVGVILALTGAGGAILAVPLLVFGMHLTLVEAGPPALLAVAVAAAVGASLGLRAGHVRYKAAGLIAAAGIVFTPLGLWAAHRAPNALLSVIFALVLGGVALRMFRQASLQLARTPAQRTRRLPPCRLDPVTGRLRWTLSCARSLAGTGVTAGFLSGLLGVGGGFVIVPALRRFTDLEMRAVVGTSLAVIALVSAGGVAAAAASGHVDWSIALPFACGAVAGMLAGRLIAGRLAGRRLQQGFAVVSGLVALGMLASLFWPIV